jgi:PucR C-terminal helix-turn-helix domain
MYAVDISQAERRSILSDVAEAIETQTPAYYEGLTDRNHPLHALRRHVLSYSLDRFIEVIRDGNVGAVDFSPIRELGRTECRYERPLGDLLRVPWPVTLQFWRYLVSHATEAGAPSATIHQYAETIMEWSGRVAASLSEGYNAELAGTVEAGRRRLVELVLRNPPVAEAEMRAAAAMTAWRLPRRLSVLVARGPLAYRVRHAIPAFALITEIDDLLVALLPDPIGSSLLEDVTGAVRDGAFAAIGPVVDLTAAHQSIDRARSALHLVEQHALGAQRVVDCSVHTVELVLLGDRDAAADHVQRWLSPLDQTKPSMRCHLEETLEAWLRHQGSAGAAAHELGVHAHTVAYRVSRLRELFGYSLDDPEKRFELGVALRLRRLLTADEEAASLAR